MSFTSTDLELALEHLRSEASFGPRDKATLLWYMETGLMSSGAGPAWKTISFDCIAIPDVGSYKSPSRETSNTTYGKYPYFNYSANEISHDMVHTGFAMPNDWQLGSDIYFFVNFAPRTEPSGVVRWEWWVTAGDEGAVWDTDNPVILSALKNIDGMPTKSVCRAKSSAPFDTSLLKEGSHVSLSLAYTSAGEGQTSTQDLYGLSFGMEYQANKIGTPQRI